MIYAEHAWKVNRQGEPIAKYFNDRVWNATGSVKRLVDGEMVVYPNSGWIMVEEATEEAPKPLKKTEAKKTTKKKTTKKKAETKKEE